MHYAAALRRRHTDPKEREVGPRDDMREAGRLLLQVNGYTFDIRLDPDRRDVRMWLAYRDGEPFVRGGLEKVWRKIQAEIALPIGRRHWG